MVYAYQYRMYSDDIFENDNIEKMTLDNPFSKAFRFVNERMCFGNQ